MTRPSYHHGTLVEMSSDAAAPAFCTCAYLLRETTQTVHRAARVAPRGSQAEWTCCSPRAREGEPRVTQPLCNSQEEITSRRQGCEEKWSQKFLGNEETHTDQNKKGD